MREAIHAEKAAVQKALGSLGGVGQLRVEGGRRLYEEPGAHVYRLLCDVEFRIPEGVRVQLQVPGQIASGETLRHDGDVLECVLREDLGADCPAGKLEFDSTFLLNLLEERLVTIASGPSASLETPGGFHRERGWAFLTGDAQPGVPVGADLPRLTESQAHVVRFVMGQEIAYVWGPPGTGKTQTVAELVHALLDRQEKVLLTAHTNIATDNALLRVLETRGLPQDDVVRVGYHAESLNRHGVGLDLAVDRSLRRSCPALVEEIGRLSRMIQELHPSQSRVLSSKRTSLSRSVHIMAGIVASAGAGPHEDLTPRIASVVTQLEEIEKRVLERARLVATTLTRCYSSRLFRDFRTDAAIVDEASTASLPLCFVVACLARRRAIAVGDFKQLPTIVQAKHRAAQEWLGRHPFETSGAGDVGVDHPLRVMLHEQWRMPPGISSVVSRVFYGGRLTDAPEVLRRAPSGPTIALLGTRRLGPRSESTPSGSKVNRVHARWIAGLLSEPVLAGQSIAVITPYRAQVRAIREAVRSVNPELLRTDALEIFTVHRFQGRDKDLVIFDLVEADGTRCTFLDDRHTAHAPNLINVAMSRAREKLLVIGVFEHIASALGARAVVNRVIATARMSGALELEAQHAVDHARLIEFLTPGRVA